MISSDDDDRMSLTLTMLQLGPKGVNITDLHLVGTRVEHGNRRAGLQELGEALDMCVRTSADTYMLLEG